MTYTSSRQELLAKIASASAHARTVGRHVVSTPGFLCCFADEPEPYYLNQVIPVSDEAETGVRAMIEVCKAHGRRVWIEYFEDLFPNLLPALKAEGLCQWQEMPMMLNAGTLVPNQYSARARPAEPSELAAVHDLCSLCFELQLENPESEIANLAEGISKGAKLVSVLSLDGEVRASGQTVSGSGISELVGICTHPEFRRRGFARAVVQDLTRRAFAAGDQITWLTPGSVSAFKLYESEGYVVSGTQIAVGDSSLREAEMILH